MTRLVLPYPPTVNKYWRHVVIRGQPRVLISREGRAYKDRVASLCVGVLPASGPIKVQAHIYRPRKIGDIDNVSKGLLDSLKGIAFHDDSQIVELHLIRHDDKARPRVEITIAAAA